MLLLLLACTGGSSTKDTTPIDSDVVDTGETGEGPGDSDSVEGTTGDSTDTSSAVDTSTLDEGKGRIEIENNTSDQAIYVIWVCDRDTDACRQISGGASPILDPGEWWIDDLDPASYQFTVQDDTTACTSKPLIVTEGEVSTWQVYAMNGIWNAEAYSCGG